MTFLFGVMTAFIGNAEIILEDVYDYRAWFPAVVRARRARAPRSAHSTTLAWWVTWVWYGSSAG
jgi:hypothetical protein